MADNEQTALDSAQRLKTADLEEKLRFARLDGKELKAARDALWVWWWSHEWDRVFQWAGGLAVVTSFVMVGMGFFGFTVPLALALSLYAFKGLIWLAYRPRYKRYQLFEKVHSSERFRMIGYYQDRGGPLSRMYFETVLRHRDLVAADKVALRLLELEEQAAAKQEQPVKAGFEPSKQEDGHV